MKKYFIPIALLLCCLISYNFFLSEREITKSQIDQALQLIGLEFNEAEIDSMYEGVKEQLEDFESNRKIILDNSVAPAILFNPLPKGFKIPAVQGSVRFTEIEKIRKPRRMDDLAYYSIPELAALLRAKQVTSVELTQFFIDRLKTHDESLHCVITITEERALRQAIKADAEISAGNYRGMLHGIPYGVKDLIAVKGYRTTWGAAPFKDQVIDMDATVVEKLDAAGAVLIAKLTMGALAMGDVWYGEKTRNPWDLTRGSSGSSAGSASAVSAGLVPFALGTETLGSIVSPSTVCGVTGLRPTYGRVSKNGAMALSWSMDKIGPICRSAEDCAIVFNTIRGTDKKDLSAIDAPFNYSSSFNVRSLKVGYLKSAFKSNYAFKENDSLALDAIKEAGVELIPIELPDYPSITFLLQAEAAAAFDELTRNNDDDQLVRQGKNAWPNSFRTARLIPAVEYIQANRLRSKLIEEMHEVMQDVDIYIHPSWRSPSLRITNMTGHPCVVVPNGLNEGRPTSISFTGQLFEEAKLLSFVKMFQDITDFDEMHPVMFE